MSQTVNNHAGARLAPLVLMAAILSGQPTSAAEWWSVKPVVRPKPPSASAHAVDAFVQSRRQKERLPSTPTADRRTLIRRLYFDLLGLPPRPERVAAFINDPDPSAYENLVDDLLKSPHFGERWARHWLDIAHYADTHGFERDKLRTHAWRYRDYVIRSFNSDKPYNDFIREQIAGDVIEPNSPEAIVATGFLAAGPWDFVGQAETKSPVLRRAARADDLDDMVTQVMTATMGMTINCARCHDHKLDPISQREYYQLWSVFAGVKRSDRSLVTPDTKRKEELQKKLRSRRSELGRLTGEGLNLADYVGGGDGRGSGVKDQGISILDGNFVTKKLGYSKDIKVNRLQKLSWPGDPANPARYVQWVFLPDGRTPVPVAYKLEVDTLPPTSGHTWDAVRNGKLQSQVHARIDGIDYDSAGHSILGLHANGGICFNLREIRKDSGLTKFRFRAMAGFGALDSAAGSKGGFSVYVDAELKFQNLKMRKDESARIDIEVPPNARYLTLVATDGGDGIGHDLFFLGDPKLTPLVDVSRLNTKDEQRLGKLRKEAERLEREVAAFTNPDKVYAVVGGTAPVINVLYRGSPEDAKDEVSPGALSWTKHASAKLGDNQTLEGERRRRLAEWIVHPDNPLTRRVIVNRLWHHHFGQGIVSTPSDFGGGGTQPSHPELLDYLADELLRQNWSLKAIHRLILTSETYKKSSLPAGLEFESARRSDAGNRFLWRQNPRRLDAESLRDAVLSTTGKLNPAMGGPGFRDFEYQEAYAPIYTYITPDKPELWRRSVYRFIVRTTPHEFLTTLDCPDAASLTPVRNRTTTPLQSLTLLNNEFMLKQAGYFAERLRAEVGTDPEAQTRRAFQLALTRTPAAPELAAGERLIRERSLFDFCRMLLNANEFAYVD
ncbi:MAG: hypothetical protein ACI9OD_000821 [Limisphaerales bacterium]|jgi:hypothetical protein